MEKKYRLTEETIEFLGRTLHRIEALRDFTTSDGEIVYKGEKGGWVESENNLSHDGNAWVYGDARVYGDALVCGGAQVYGDARVCGSAQVYGDARVCGSARVYDDARVCGDAQVYGNARVCGGAQVYGNARVCGSARVYGDAQVYEPWHILVIGPIGSRNDYTTFFQGKDRKIYVKCGCFCGDIKEFTAKVEETHGNNHHGKMYKLAIEMAKEQMRGGTDA